MADADAVVKYASRDLYFTCFHMFFLSFEFIPCSFHVHFMMEMRLHEPGRHPEAHGGEREALRGEGGDCL